VLLHAKGSSKQAERSASLKPYSAHQPARQRQEEQGTTNQSISALQPAQEEAQPIDKATLVVAFVEAMQANMAQSSNPGQADMDEAIRKQKELEEMCAHQRQMVLLYEERRHMESVRSPATIQEMLKLSLEARNVGSTGHVRKKIVGNVAREAGPGC
jgi:hypothetical protein